jgi:hypothetical protein
MHLILVAPGLLAQSPGALGAERSLALLARFAGAPYVHATGIANALLDALGAPAGTPVAPLAALGAGIDAGADYVQAADPVLLAADRDDVVLVHRVDDLAAHESEALTAMLNRHFETDDVRFVAARTDAWFARSVRPPAIETTPFDSARARGIFPHLPGGTEGGVWRRWQNEIGMLLHEHPVNVARQAAGDPGVTGVWFWGGGRLADVVGLPCTTVAAAPGAVGDLARGVARHTGGTTHPLDAGDSPGRVIERASSAGGHGDRHAVAVVESITDDAGVAALGAQWLAPALDLLERQRIHQLSLVADGSGAALRWKAPVPTSWQRVVARAGRRPFVVPRSLEP